MLIQTTSVCSFQPHSVQISAFIIIEAWLLRAVKSIILKLVICLLLSVVQMQLLFILFVYLEFYFFCFYGNVEHVYFVTNKKMGLLTLI